MHSTRTTAACLFLLAALSACGSQATGTSTSTTDGRGPAKGAPSTARTVFQELSRSVGTATMTGTVTAADDPNHLLGRPHEYTSKVTFSDSFVAAGDVTGAGPGDIERGGAVEVFADAADAEARAQYIRGVTKSMPALAEYDYVRGRFLVRVSRYLTPERAALYGTAVARLS
jgi:hypothetical protein